MNRQETLDFLQSLIDQTKAMSNEEFAEREKQLGVDKLTFDPRNYEPPDCTIPEDTECHAHCGAKCYNEFQCRSHE